MKLFQNSRNPYLQIKKFAKLRALRALVPYVLRALRALVTHVPCVSRAFCPAYSRAPRPSSSTYYYLFLIYLSLTTLGS